MQIKNKSGKFVGVPVTQEMLAQHFLKYIDASQQKNSCWEWQGERARDGKYGICRLRRKGQKQFGALAHRFSFEHFSGKKIPGGFRVCHRCDNPICVNPNHLFLGTDKDNSDDKVRKSRQSKGIAHSAATRAAIPNGEKHYRAKLSENDIKDICELHHLGLSYREIAAVFGVNTSAAHKICKGVRWRHIER